MHKLPLVTLKLRGGLMQGGEINEAALIIKYDPSRAQTACTCGCKLRAGWKVCKFIDAKEYGYLY